MSLASYRKKRKFKQTPEPKGRVQKKHGPLAFVVQKHDASHLHYDLRLEWEGVLKSFAIPKGPSLNPNEKRLAIQTEDHPLNYGSFEGHIPEGNYGAGEVLVWDQGIYRWEEAKTEEESRAMLKRGFKKGHLAIELFGGKLKGRFSLVKMSQSDEKAQWLFIKRKDAHASIKDILKEKKSVLTGKKLERDTRRKQTKKDFSLQPMPHNLTPMLATLTEGPFNESGWLFEQKYDGYRTLAEIKAGKVHLFSRSRQYFDQKFKVIQEALQVLKHDVILDGEVVGIQNGKMRFEALQNSKDPATKLKYFVFDLLYLDGFDLRKAPLVERKKLLRQLLQNSKHVAYSPHRLKNGERYFREIEQKGGEGLIAKKADSPYQAGARSRDWLKIKTEKRQEVVIGGFTTPQKSRHFFGALLAGIYNPKGELEFVGHVGGGFDDPSLKKVFQDLQKRVRKTCPFKNKPETNTPATWVKPTLVAEVKFKEWTEDLKMRQPVFLGLREDKGPKEVTKEETKTVPQKARGDNEQGELIKFTHLDKVLWPHLKTTKRELIDYYQSIAKVVLPYLKDRPINLLRHPHGVGKESFYQKNVSTLKLPTFAESVSMYSQSNQSEIQYLLCNNVQTLLYMTQLGVIEIHPWNSRVGTIEKPDYMIFDVDPSDNDFQKVVQVTLAIKEVLDGCCKKSFLKTSGKTGMHVLVPLGGKYDYAVAREFAHLLMQLVHQKIPELTSLERNPQKRQKKVYLDYLQNREGQTLVAPYSLRATPEATVSTPLEWEEVNETLDPKQFTLKTVQKRLKQKGDLWKNLHKEKVDLKKAIEKLKNEMNL